MEKTLGFPKFWYMGRMGNMLFELASAYGIAKKSGRKLVLPCWPYEKYFKGRVEIVERKIEEKTEIKEQGFSYCGEYFQARLKGPQPHYNISGYLQSERFFEHCIQDVKEFFTWETSEFERVYEKYFSLINKQCTAVHVRRGDYVGHEGYINLPLDYYKSSLNILKDRGDVLVFSDDIGWCIKNMQLLSKNIHFIQGNSPIEDLYLMSLCNNCVIANSSFSWWGAWLGEGKGEIIHPGVMFKGSMKDYNIKDYYPKRWTENKKWTMK